MAEFKVEVGQSKEPESKLSQAARDYLIRWESEHNQDDKDVLEIERQFVDSGRYIHARSWAHTQDDREAWSLFQHGIIEEWKAGNTGIDPVVFTGPGAFEAFAWVGKWASCGYQSIEIDDSYAASLCATTISPDSLKFVALPWPCFIIRVPGFLRDMLVNDEPLRSIAVCRFQCGPDWDFIHVFLLTANKYRRLVAKDLAEFNVGKGAGLVDVVSREERELATTDERLLATVGRLIIGACLTMSNPSETRTLSATPGMRKPSFTGPRKGTDPMVTLHKVGKPVVVDVRLAIRSYLGGTGEKVTVRTLVAGHWKRQPHGPGMSQRRWQRIDCYWRGPDEAPVVVRPHVIPDKRPE